MTPTRRQLLAAAAAVRKFPIRPDYLEEAPGIPDFWLASVNEIERHLATGVKKGRVVTLGRSAGGRPVRAVHYGQPRAGRGATTFSGSLGFGDPKAYRGPDHGKRVYLALCGVHGGEFEGMAGAVNLLSVLETGADLRGKPWPAIAAAAERIHRILVIPILNPDGRARVPLRMIKHRGRDETVHEYFNTGGKKDGSIIGWPQCKEFIPLDFRSVQFPGGYPNDAGVNLMHDDFFGARQPETGALLRLCAEERPDLILNMHTGASWMHPLRPFSEPALTPVFESLYRDIMTALTRAGLAATDDIARHSDPSRERMSPYNLDTVLNLHCGALSVVVESPAHDYSPDLRMGQPWRHTPDLLIDAQMICHGAAMNFLAATGGRSQWTRPQPRA
jgi:hypothetical protein